jgi:hypothetical protein
MAASRARTPTERRLGLPVDDGTVSPAEAVAYYRALIEAGMQYFIAFVYGNDLDTPRLLMEQVAPELRTG